MTVFDQIKENIDLATMIGQSVDLKRSGSTYRGLCPFHQEKTPSFYVRPETNRYYCYGCDVRGDCFDWLIEHDHLSFKEALHTLAGIAGVNLDDNERREREQHILEILAETQQFYESALRAGTNDAQYARKYLKHRGITSETCRKFGIGYAPGCVP